MQGPSEDSCLFQAQKVSHMNTTSLRGMFEATRLTRAGRLTEATAFLQNLLQSRAEPVTANRPAGAKALIIEGVAGTVETADAAPTEAVPVHGMDVGRERSR